MSDRIASPGQPAVCQVLRAGASFVGKQGFSYAPAVSAESVGASAIHMQLLTMPPGARAKAHKHRRHETAIYVLSGEAGMHYGERLEQHLSRAPATSSISPPTAAPALQPEPDRTLPRRGLAHRSQRAGKRRPAAGARRNLRVGRERGGAPVTTSAAFGSVPPEAARATTTASTNFGDDGASQARSKGGGQCERSWCWRC